MIIISLREQPEYAPEGIAYIQEKWANEDSMALYQDCIQSSLVSSSTLPQWYIALDESRIVGCVGLITNDFISRMDLWPWLCTLYVEEADRNKGIGQSLVNYVVKDAIKLGYDQVYLCTDHIGYYEKFGFEYIGDGYHPWGEKSRIYQI